MTTPTTPKRYLAWLRKQTLTPEQYEQGYRRYLGLNMAAMNRTNART